MRLTKLFILAAFFILFSELKGQSCKDLPKSFNSYSELKHKIKNSIFKIEDKVNCSRSSWISKASFHSCDGETGFFILATKNGKDYIHQDMPLKVWKQFKAADSFGSYYNRNIREKYQLKI